MQTNPDEYLDSLPELQAERVTGFEIHRSLASNTLYSVFAVDFFGEILYPVCVDVTWDWAVKTKEDQEKELQST